MTTPWLQRLHAGLFAIPFGLFTLSAAWQRGIGFGWGIAEDISAAVLDFSFVIWMILLLLFLAKMLRYPSAVLDEYLNPVQGALMALLPLSMLMFVIVLGHPGSIAWLALTLFALAIQLVIAARVVSILALGQIQHHTVTPALYLPTAAGGFMGAIAMAVLGYTGWGALLFGMALAAWALLEARVLNRLFHGPLPETLRPIIGIEMAPPAAATLAAGAIWPALPGEVLIVGLGIASGPVLTVFLRYRLWSKVPFAVGFWSFSFPMAGFAGAMVEVVRRGHWPSLVGGFALLMASAVIAFLLVRTLILLWNGQLLPPGMSTPSSKQEG